MLAINYEFIAVFAPLYPAIRDIIGSVDKSSRGVNIIERRADGVY
jgi:hypothetical protein